MLYTLFSLTVILASMYVSRAGYADDPTPANPYDYR